MRSLLIIALGLVVAALCMTEVNGDAQEVCDTLSNVNSPKLRYIRNKLNHLSFPDINLDISPGHMINITLNITDVKISGVGDVYFGKCEVNDPNVTVTLVLDMVEVSLVDYSIGGNLAGTLDITGAGLGVMNLENVTAVFTGPLVTDPDLHFESVYSNIGVWKSVVDFEGFMTGTDLEYLLNEFLSMVGPEIVESMEIYINNNYPEQITAFSNEILNLVTGKLPLQENN